MWCPIQIPCPIFAAVILQCEKPLHHWSYALMPSFAKNRLTMKFWGLYLQYLQKLSWNFHLSLSGCSDIAGNQQYITGLSIYYRDVTCSDGLKVEPKKIDYWLQRSGQWDKILTFHLGQTEHSSARVDGPHIDQLCICALTLARAFTAPTCFARQCARRYRSRQSPNILTVGEPIGLSSRSRLL